MFPVFWAEKSSTVEEGPLLGSKMDAVKVHSSPKLGSSSKVFGIGRVSSLHTLFLAITLSQHSGSLLLGLQACLIMLYRVTVGITSQLVDSLAWNTSLVLPTLSREDWTRQCFL